MSKVRIHVLRSIARRTGADLRRLVREFKGMSAVQIMEAVK